MENITKALLIAAGVLIAIILTTLLVIGYNQISGYYQEQSNVTEVKQIIEMSKKFVNYEEKEIRGNEMLSVINMVEDYNEWVKQNPNEGYNEITLNVVFKNSNNLSNGWYNDFHYEEGSYNYLINNDQFKIDNSNMKKISYRMSECLSSLQEIVPNATESTVQSLASNIDTISPLISKTHREDMEEKTINLLMNNIFKIDNFSTFSMDNRKKIDKIAHQYYELTYFKRAYFICTKIKQDSNGRVTLMNFEIETTNGSVKFN